MYLATRVAELMVHVKKFDIFHINISRLIRLQSKHFSDSLCLIDAKLMNQIFDCKVILDFSTEGCTINSGTRVLANPRQSRTGKWGPVHLFYLSFHTIPIGMAVKIR